MRSFITSAVLASAAFGQTAYSAVSAHRHNHAHLHEKKSAAPAVEKRNINVASVLSKAGVVEATNSAAIETGNGGPFVIDFCNDSGKDIVVVAWTGESEQDMWTSMCVNKYAPSMTQPILPGESTTISIDPSKVGGSVSGGFAALYPYTDLSNAGSINNTWAEFTYTTASQFSAVDVTRLVNMVGNEMSIETYASYPPTGNALCTSDMDTCVFQCTDNSNSCLQGSLLNCEGANTQNFQGTSGGCGGFTAQGGYTKISFKE